MSTEEKDKILEIIADGLGVAKEELQPQLSLRDDLGGDSLDLIEIIMSIEKEFGVSVSDEQYDNINTVDDVLNLIV